MASEILEIIPVSNDHNSTGSGIDKRDYTYTEHNITTHGYPSYAGTVAKPGTIKGGLLSVDYDTEELGGGALQMSLFLFDADGNPYKHTGYADGSGATYFGDDDVGFIGELYEPTYVDPAPEDNPAVVNAGYSYGSLLGPFTTKIPDGCTVMVYVRCVTYPCGNFADRIALGQWLYEGGITFTVSDYVEEDTNDPEDDTDGSGATTDYPTNFWPYLNVLGVVGKEIPCLTGSGAPGKGTPGGVGSLYMNTVNGKVYKCTAVTDGVYTWKALTSSSSGSGTSYSVPEYWKDHLDTKIETIKSLQAGKDCFSFIVIADLHYSENKGRLSPHLARYIMDACDIKYLLCLGDMQTQAAVKSEDFIHDEWEGIKEMFEPVWDRTLMTLGNHDGAWGQLDSNSDGTVDKYYCYNLTPAELYEYVFRKVGMIPGVTFDASGNGFYVDDPACHVRYIILNTSCTEYAENADGTAMYNYMNYQRLGQDQVDMVVEALQTVPGDEWGVVIGTHIPLVGVFGDGYVGDRDSLMGILEAYQNKESGVYQGWSDGTDMGWSVADVDFSNAKGSIVGAFAGHMHGDADYTGKAFPIVLTDSDCEPTDDRTHEAGTDTEQSFDVFTVNRETGVIYATKIGYGEDRVIS